MCVVFQRHADELLRELYRISTCSKEFLELSCTNCSFLAVVQFYECNCAKLSKSLINFIKFPWKITDTKRFKASKSASLSFFLEFP